MAIVNQLWSFMFNLLEGFSDFATWLVTPLDYINVPPLAFFGVGALSTIVAFKLIRLFVGG